MKDYNYNEATIQQYLLNELSEQERRDFEKALRTDAALAQAVEEQRKVIEGIEYFAAQEFKAKLQDLYTEVRPEIIGEEVPAQRRSRWLLLGLALLAVLTTLFFAYHYLKPNSPPAPQLLFAQNYEAYQWSPTLRSDTFATQLNQVLDLYNSQAYSEAIPLLEKIIQEGPQDIPSRLALISTYLANRQAELALPHLNQITQLNDILYQDQARWYTALAYLQINQTDKAKTILQTLAADKNADYHQAAQDLMEDLP